MVLQLSRGPAQAGICARQRPQRRPAGLARLGGGGVRMRGAAPFPEVREGGLNGPQDPGVSLL